MSVFETVRRNDRIAKSAGKLTSCSAFGGEADEHGELIGDCLRDMCQLATRLKLLEEGLLTNSLPPQIVSFVHERTSAEEENSNSPRSIPQMTTCGNMPMAVGGWWAVEAKGELGLGCDNQLSRIWERGDGSVHECRLVLSSVEI